ncbi:hypothetical protein LJR153_003453 [Paenibacillus sp. LjRoot153]|uniref:hypothetical protein n=1 Tax=Paenibacillus sp. LjRoot153 TaxID=3342270 RepID=UPI003ECED251
MSWNLFGVVTLMKLDSGLIYILKSAEYDEENSDLNFQDDEEVSDWQAEIIWNNYHKCTLSSTYWGEASGFKQAPYIYDGSGTIELSTAFDSGNIKIFYGNSSTIVQSFTAGTWSCDQKGFARFTPNQRRMDG